MPKILTRCLVNERAFDHCSLSGLLLRFPHIQLTMKRHLHGPSHGFLLEAFQITEVVESDLHKMNALLSVEAQINSNELLMRTQQWVLLPYSWRDEFITYSLHFCHLCRHIRSLGRGEDSLNDLLRSRLELLEEKGWCSAATAQCLKCPMDFVMDFKDLR